MTMMLAVRSSTARGIALAAKQVRSAQEGVVSIGATSAFGPAVYTLDGILAVAVFGSGVVRASEPARSGSRVEDPDLWKLADELISKVPVEDWARVPKDLASRLDEYLYRTKPAE